MPRGCCDGGSSCSCLIQGRGGARVTGSGTPVDPYVVDVDVADLGAVFTVRDTDSVNLTLLGSGTPASPFELRAESTLRMSDLSDVQDPGGAPLAGESPVYVGVHPTGHWEFGTLPPAPAGSVNVGDGIVGTGAAASPIRVNTSGTWGSGALAGLGSDTTSGQPIYADASGQLRAAPLPASASPSWSSIQNKPTTFAPASHTHAAKDISDQRQLDVGKINGKTITTTTSSSTRPSNPGVGDLHFFPKGS